MSSSSSDSNINFDIQNYIDNLISNNTDINIIDFIKQINRIKYNIDLTFMNELMEYVNQDSICIPHTLFKKYKIMSLSRGSTDIIVLIKQYELKEHMDYELVRNVPDQLSSGTKYKNEYYFHPKAFKFCLIRAKNTKLYAHYYLLLEECIKHYNDYRYKMKQSEVSRMIDELKETRLELKESNKKLDDQTKELIESNNRLSTLENQNKEFNKKLDDQTKELIESNNRLSTLENQNTELIDKVDILNAKVDIATNTRVVATKKKSDQELVLLFKNNNNNMYYISRISKKSQYNTRIKMNDEKFNEIFKLSNTPNSVNIFKLFKQEFKNEYNFNGNYFTPINDINDNTIINQLKVTFDKRKNI